MPRHDASLIWFGLGIVFFVLVSVLTLTAAFAASAPGESIDQLYEKAKKDGKLTLYAPLSARSMEVILPAFMKRFPGVTVNHIDSTPNQLLARVLRSAWRASARGRLRRVVALYGANQRAKLIAPLTVPEAAAYPAQMKSDFWVATDTQFYIAGWNTNLVKKATSRRATRISPTRNGRAI
jgi:hypothetical protein